MQQPASTGRSRARSAALLAGVCVAGGLGALPGSAGAFDALALLGWLATIGVGAGWLLGGSGLWLRHALAAPGAWSLWLALVLMRGERALATPLDAMGVVLGLFLCGWALGRLAGRACAGAGATLFAALVLSGLSVQGGFPDGPPGAGAGTSEDASPGPGAEHPALARALLAVSPLVLVLESAGQDVTHANPLLYRSSGIEWFQRRPWQGRLAAPAALVVGCLAAALAAAFGRARPREPAA